MKKKCSKCEALFICESENNKNCWCFKIEIPKLKIYRLRRRYKDCLCQKCLKLEKLAL